MDEVTPVRTRMAPSPTGEYHIGHIRTLLFDYALAKQHKGQFVMRIEDTDRDRYVEGAEQRILQTIRDYGLSWNEGPDIGGPYEPYRQSERLELYHEWVQKLLDTDAAYYCFCTKERLDELRLELQKAGKQPKYDGLCQTLNKDEAQERVKTQPHVIRLKVPENRTIAFHDYLRGEIAIKSEVLDDQVLVKSDGFPTYHLAVVVDDIIMKITHIIRGEEWLSSTPKHILLYEAFGHEPPVFAHVPVILDPSGKGKMSKRTGSVSARSFLDEGYLPEAMLNFLVLLGWAPKDNRELFTLEEFVQNFSLDGLQLKSPVFDKDKLDWFNGHYIRQKSDEELAHLLMKFAPDGADEEAVTQIVPLIKERIKKLSEFDDLAGFFFEEPDVTPDLVPVLFEPKSPMYLRVASEVVSESKWELDELKTKFMDVINKNAFNTSDFFMSLRGAIAGSRFTPPIVESIVILGREKTLNRIENALKQLSL